MKKQLIPLLLAAGLTGPALAAENYVIDTRGQHAFIKFRVPHLGFSWLYGRFNSFEGEFTFDPEAPENSSVRVTIDPASVDTNHERRDEHLRGSDFLSVEDHAAAGFESTAFVPLGDDRYRLEGNLTLLGKTAPIQIDVEQIGAGPDPWGGYRRGFEGTTTLNLKDWGISYELPSAEEVELTVSIEGVRQD